MRETNDEQLMQDYSNGNAQAFDQLYTRHRGALYRYFNHQLGNSAMVNDLYQGVWEKVIRARRSYRPAVPFTAWLFTIAHNHLIDHYRRQRPVNDSPTDSLADGRPGPEQTTISAEQQQHLLHGIAALPVEQKNTLLLKLESRLKMKEIARLTGVSRETVKSRLRYAVNKLKQLPVE